MTLTACVWDLRTKKIPNCLIGAGLAAGACLQADADGVLSFVGGTGIPLLLLGGLFYFRMLGAGDIKLLCAVGGFLGMEDSVRCVLISVLTGGALAGILMLKRRNLMSRLQYFLGYCRDYAKERRWKPYEKGESQGGTFHFSVPILVSVLLFVGGVY